MPNPNWKEIVRKLIDALEHEQYCVECAESGCSDCDEGCMAKSVKKQALEALSK